MWNCPVARRFQLTEDLVTSEMGAGCFWATGASAPIFGSLPQDNMSIRLEPSRAADRESKRRDVVGFMPARGAGNQAAPPRFRLPKPSHPGRRILNSGMRTHRLRQVGFKDS